LKVVFNIFESSEIAHPAAKSVATDILGAIRSKVYLAEIASALVSSTATAGSCSA